MKYRWFVSRDLASFTKANSKLAGRVKAIRAATLRCGRVKRRLPCPYGHWSYLFSCCSYLEDPYGLGRSDPQRQLFPAWSHAGPPDEWETKRNQQMAQRQGNGNRVMETWSKKEPGSGSEKQRISLALPIGNVKWGLPSSIGRKVIAHERNMPRVSRRVDPDYP